MHQRRIVAAVPVFVCLLFVADLCGRANAQDAAPVPAPAARTLAVVVHDKHGAPQAGVSQGALQLVIDSKPVAIVSLEPSAAKPLAFGLVIDTNRRQERVLDEEKKPDEQFLEGQVDQAGSQGFVIHYDRQIELMQDLTSSKPLLHKAVEDLTPAVATSEDNPDNDSSREDDEDSHARRVQRKDERLYDAVFLAADEVLRAARGRRAMVVISDGVDHGSKESLASAVEAAQRTGTVVYAIYVEGEQDRTQQQPGNQGSQRRSGGGGGIGWPGSAGGGWPGGGSGGGGGNGGGRRGGQTASHEPDGRKVLQELARKTGGAMYEARKKSDVTEALDRIAQDWKNEMLLSFQPDPASTGDFHRVAVTATEREWKVQVAEAYYTHP